MTRIVAGALCVGLMTLGAGDVSSQTTSTGSGQAYPTRPIRMIAAPPGGNGDLHARLIAQGITGPLEQPVVVENRPTTVLPELLAKAQPDGYTLLLAGSAVWIAPLLQKQSYDPLKDFAPVTIVTSSPDIVVVIPSLPVNSIKDLIALAKAKPGALNYASGATGTSSHLSPELLKAMAGVNIVRVVYTGTGPIITAMLGGEVQISFSSVGAVGQYIKSGKLKALAVASAQPSPRFPGLPTVAATLPGFEPVTALVVFAPAKTPGAVINRLNREIVRVLNQADVKEKLVNAGVDVVGSPPEEAMAVMKTDIARMGKLIKDAGIKVD